MVRKMSDILEIKHTSRVIYARLPDNSKAFIRYRVENGVMKLVETYTPPQHRGKGVAKKLMQYAIELAKKNNWLVEPICSYSIYYFIKYPEHRELLIPEYRKRSDEELKELFRKRLEEERNKDKE
ncbi:acetyltransferase-like protein [Staphylothermus hellenicus DSM 12710]|uniref:Acetyltransferase-like protein n=2 Tax=Staphylothermus hellenicus TaxID=84599 RepID=D7DC14_STAHD|nr:acetyltransferase-like protein [Staphylothermus hellenicus DSM 12710]